jgi:hypothetical protein
MPPGPTEGLHFPRGAKRRPSVHAGGTFLRPCHNELQQAQGAGKRQAAPFAKGPPRSELKRPGCKPCPDYGPKAHWRPPAHIDEVHEAPLRAAN